VLDLGCNAGFYSIEMKKRNAARVVGVDLDDRYLRQASFAAATLQLDIEFLKMSVYEADTIPGEFDYVLFMGVFYHLRYPLYALDRIVKKVRGRLIFQTMLRGELPYARRIAADRMREAQLIALALHRIHQGLAPAAEPDNCRCDHLHPFGCADVAQLAIRRVSRT